MKTVLITGASEGIGFEFTSIFAKEGYNLVLVARNEAKLQQMQDDLSSDGKIKVMFYARDLSIPDNAVFIYNDLKQKGIHVDVLINNAGFGINGNYTDIEWDRELQMLHLNMITLAYFTKMFARDMVERKFGRILNVGSTGSFQPGPFMAGYCATKAFVLSLSEAVNYELKGTNVSVTTLCPGVTDTKFHHVAKTLKTNMSKALLHAGPAEVAEYGYKILMRKQPVGIHGFMNKLIVSSYRIFPRNLITASAAYILKSKEQ